MDKPDIFMLNVIMGQLNSEMEHLIWDFQNGYQSFDHMRENIGRISEDLSGKRIDVEPYRKLFEYAREYRTWVKMHAGILPESYAQILKE